MSVREEKKVQFENNKKASFVPVVVLGLVLLAGTVLIHWKFF